MQKVLILGNGFDLAHNLPTRYTDFLNFIDIVSIIYRNGGDVVFNAKISSVEDDDKKSPRFNDHVKDLLKDFYSNYKQGKADDEPRFAALNKLIRSRGHWGQVLWV